MERLELPAGGAVEYAASWLSPAEQAALHAALVRELAWEQRDVVLFGKRVPQPRLIAWAGELPYRYSGQTLEPRPYPAPLRDALGRVVAATGVAFNHVLVNRYRDGRDGMGMHADAEPELGRDPVVATLSCGAVRRLVIAPRRGKGPRFSYELAPGSLLVMRGAAQENYRHGVPKDPRVAAERLSLTFRRLLRAPAR